LILLLVIVAGILMRMVGLPLYVPDSGDEWGNTVAPLRLLFERGDPNTFFHPSLYYYVTAVVYVVLFSVLKLTGLVNQSVSMTDLFVLDERYFVFAARGVSVACAALAMYAIHGLAKSLWRRQEGLVAAALLAVLPLHVLYSKTVRVDSLFLLLFVVAFSRIVRILNHPDQRTYDKAGLLTGLATAANYNGAVLGIWLIAAHFLAVEREGVARNCGSQTLGGRKLIRALLLAVAVFFVTSPFVLLNLDTFVRNFAFISGLSLTEHAGWEGRDVLFYATDLARVNPYLFALLVVSSLAIACFGNRVERFVLSLPVGYFLLFSLISTKDNRFMLPAMLLFLVVASGLPSYLSRRAGQRRPLRILLSALSYTLLFSCMGTMAIQSIPILPHEALTPAERPLFVWIEENVPRRSKILVESGIVPLVDTIKEPGRLAAELRKSIVATRPNLDQQFIGAVYVGGRNYDARMVADQRIDYAVIAKKNVRYIEGRCDAFPEVCDFYAALRDNGRVVFETPEGFEQVVVYEVGRAHEGVRNHRS
jgi:hypothetical protein